jgi:inner membrane protein
MLALALLIPISMISGLVSERQERRDGAVSEVSSKWGGVQSITGPVLVVPYQHRWREGSGNQQVTRSEIRHAIFLAESLRVKGAIDAEIRQRGIFSVPVYGLELALEGEFARPDVSQLGIDPGAVDWQRIQLAVGISDVRAIGRETFASWDGRDLSFLPGTGAFSDAGTGIHLVVEFPEQAQLVEFSVPLSLNGSAGLHLAPFGRNTSVELESDYAHPSFQGNWLPAERSVSSSGLSASWSIPFLGRNYPQAWKTEISMSDAIAASRFGIGLIDPVDHYRMAERSVKYASLFIVLTFAALWLIEVLAGLRVHPIQYLMLGGALCVFYLLELSLSEHLGFPLAYALASVAVVGMVGAYSLSVLHRARRALVVAIGLSLLYAYLYILLMNEDYSLLIGSLGLFAMLGAIMYTTRRVDWYAVSASGRSRGTAEAAR